MKLWRASFYDWDEERLEYSWHATRREAERTLTLKQLERAAAGVWEGRDEEGVALVEIPRTRAELLVWLNDTTNHCGGRMT